MNRNMSSGYWCRDEAVGVGERCGVPSGPRLSGHGQNTDDMAFAGRRNNCSKLDARCQCRTKSRLTMFISPPLHRAAAHPLGLCNIAVAVVAGAG